MSLFNSNVMSVTMPTVALMLCVSSVPMCCRKQRRLRCTTERWICRSVTSSTSRPKPITSSSRRRCLRRCTVYFGFRTIPDFERALTITLILPSSQAVASENEKVGLKHPGLMLKYSTYKNLASLAVLRDDLDTATDFYVEVTTHHTRHM